MKPLPPEIQEVADNLCTDMLNLYSGLRVFVKILEANGHTERAEFIQRLAYNLNNQKVLFWSEKCKNT